VPLWHSLFCLKGLCYITPPAQRAFNTNILLSMIINKYFSTTILLALSISVSAQRSDHVQSAIDAEQYESAKALLKTELRLQPKAGDTYYTLGSVYLKTGYPDSAKAMFTQGLRADAKNPLNYVGVGKLNLETDNTHAAKVNFDKAVSLSSRRKYQAHLAIGVAYIESEIPGFNAALPYLQKADELDKADKDARIFLALGDYYALEGQTAQALAQYTRASQLDTTLMQVGIHIASMYLRAGNYTEANNALQAVLNKNANFGPAFRMRSKVYQQQYLADRKPSDASLATENYRRYLDATGRSPEAQLDFANLLYKLGDFRALETELAALTSLDPASTSALTVHRLRGYANYENGNYPAALQYMNSLFERIGDKNRLTADDYAYMSLIQQKLKLTDNALENAGKALKLDSSKTIAMEGIAREYYTARNWEKVISSYEHLKGLGGKPANVGEVGLFHGTALFFRYVEAFNKGENPSTNLLLQAKALFDQVLKEAPDQFEAHLWSARTLSLLEDQQFPQGAMVLPYQAYIEAAERSTQAQSAATKRNVIEASNAIAGFAATRGDREKARTYWSKVLSLDPQNSVALSGMKTINTGGRSTKNR
jgi:tetratricopeptide (TPR) repeat protein